MKKTIFSILWRLAVLAAAAACGVYAYRLATGYYDLPVMVGVVSAQQPLSYLNAEDYTAALADVGCDVRIADAALSADEAALQLIGQGASVVVIGSDVPITNAEIFSKASAGGTTLLFVGAAPQQQLLDSCDKAWVLENDAAYGGQLLGRQAALAFREGALSDADDDKLLDCAGFLPADYPASGVVGREFLAECEHYGVYTDLHHNFTVAASELEHSAEEVWLPAQLPEDPLLDDTAGDTSDISQPEALFCAGSQAAQTAHKLADSLGWLDSTQIFALAESLQSAQTLQQSGIAAQIAYYDQADATRTLAAMTRNALNHQFIAQGLDRQPDENKHLILAYQLLE